MSLYGLDESVQRLLRTETFQDGFNLQGFIEELGQSESAAGANERDALDPKPYIRLFEATLAKLKDIQSTVAAEEEANGDAVARAELVHSNNVVELAGLVSGTMDEFGQVDEVVSDITGSTAFLSDKLEVLSGQYEQTVTSSFLIRCYLSFVRKGSSSDLERLWTQGGPSERHHCANVVSQLQGLSKRTGSTPSAVSAREAVDRFAELLEKDLLDDFDKAYPAADLPAMKESAAVLTDFNGGSSVVQVFVNRHDFFIMQENLVDKTTLEVDNPDLFQRMSDPSGPDPRFEQLVESRMDEIRLVVASETEIIKKVFPHPTVVLRVFLQRIFAQRIQQQLEAYLQAAESASALAYMRCLHISYSKGSALVKSLKDMLQESDTDSDGELSALLDQNFADLFLPLIDSGRYFDSERQCLQELVSRSLSRFSEAHSQRKYVRDQSLFRFTSSDASHADRDMIGASSGGSEPQTNNLSSTANGTSEKRRIGQLMRVVGLERSNSGQDRNSRDHAQVPDDTYLYDLEVHYEVVQRVLGSFAEAVSRLLELSPLNAVRNYAGELLRFVIDALGYGYVDVSLDDTLATCTDDKSSLNLQYLRVLPRASGAVKLISTFAKTVFFPMVSGSDSALNSMTSLLNSYVTAAEEKANLILQQTVELIVAKLGSTLAKQKKKDFNVSKDTAGISETPVCVEARDFLVGLRGVAVECLDGGNLDSFLLEVGSSFREMLMSHLKKFTVSPAGGIILLRDLQAYQQAVDEWSIPELTRSFAILHDIGSLFTVEPQVLNSLIRETGVNQLKPYLIREYVSKRVDYNSNSISRLITSGTSRLTRHPVVF